MNNPEYILTDVFAEIAAAVKTALGLAVLNYQFGYVTELNETLQQYSKTEEWKNKMFPLLWFTEPFTIARGDYGIYGTLTDGNIFLINATEKTLKATERMQNNFKPVLYPIYRETLNQISKHTAFQQPDAQQIDHTVTNRYWWGEQEKAALNFVVDCIKIGNLKLRVTSKQDSQAISNF